MNFLHIFSKNHPIMHTVLTNLNLNSSFSTMQLHAHLLLYPFLSCYKKIFDWLSDECQSKRRSHQQTHGSQEFVWIFPLCLIFHLRKLVDDELWDLKQFRLFKVDFCCRGSWLMKWVFFCFDGYFGVWGEIIGWRRKDFEL